MWTRGASWRAPACVLSVAVAAVVCAGAAPYADVARAAEPVADEFYTPPSRLSGMRPGDVIRAESIAAPPGAKAWRVLYRSETVAGDSVAVSGVVVAPEERSRTKRPIVTWAHGTTGIADACAPSRLPDAATRLPYVSDLIGAGYVLAATDYEGLGTPGVHPYLVGQSEGRSALDLDALLTPGARTQLGLLDDSCSGDVIDAYRATQGSVFAVDPRATAPWDDLLAENTPARVPTEAPILMVQGTGDTLVLPVLTSSFLPKLCGAGNVAEYRAYEGATHGSVLQAARADILAWLEDRLSGVSAVSGCT